MCSHNVSNKQLPTTIKLSIPATHIKMMISNRAISRLRHYDMYDKMTGS